MPSPDDISVDHIDPLHSDHVCGLDNDLNKILKSVSYNAAKSNKFVPYRVELFGAPQEFGDTAEFLIDGQWIVCEFGGDTWHTETRRIGCGSTKNRVCETNPELHSAISSMGGKAAVAAGYHYGANGCHTSENQRSRALGKLWWHHPKTGEIRRSTVCPEGFVEGRPSDWIERMKEDRRGRQHCHDPVTGESRMLREIPEGWVKGRPKRQS